MEEEKIEREEVPIIADVRKAQLRERVKADVEAFLKSGGEYTDCPNLDLRKYSNVKRRRVYLS
jgi:hypothetical protein